MAISGWGLGPVGFTPWGIGTSLETAFTVLFAEVVGERTVEIEFSAPVYWSGLSDRSDAANAARYQINVIGGSGIEGDSPKPVLVSSVERVTETRVRIYTDRPFASHGVGYSVATNRIISTLGEDLSGEVFYFQGSRQGLLPPLTELVARNRDFANPQTQRSMLDPLPDPTNLATLGTYPVDETGDYAVDEGVANIRKRVIRRLMTRKGAFAHLPDYGSIAHANIKRIGKPGVRELIATDAEQQIRLEPDVVGCSVSVEIPSPGVVRYRIRVKTRVGIEVALEPCVQIE